MSWTLATTIIVFAFVASITPGPNNIMLLSSGATFGLRRTLPHLAGVVIGFAVMIAVMGLGLSQVIARVPVLFSVVRWLGAAYLVYLAFRIATSQGLSETQATKPLGFLAAAAFQWVNPKCWAIALGAFSAYVDQDQSAAKVALILLLFPPVNAVSVTVWAVAGTAIKRLLSGPRALRAFNVTMGLTLVLSLYPMLHT